MTIAPRHRNRVAAAAALAVTALSTYAIAQQGPAPGKQGPGQMMHGHGMHGGMMEGGPGCPMASDLADVQIEKTKTGAVIRLAAKNPADVEKVQRMALMAALHFGADASAMMPPASQPRPAAKP